MFTPPPPLLCYSVTNIKVESGEKHYGAVSEQPKERRPQSFLQKSSIFTFWYEIYLLSSRASSSHVHLNIILDHHNPADKPTVRISKHMGDSGAWVLCPVNILMYIHITKWTWYNTQAAGWINSKSNAKHFIIRLPGIISTKSDP